MRKKATPSSSLNPTEVIMGGIATCVQSAIKNVFKKTIVVSADLFELPPNPAMGDYALPCFTFASTIKMAPPHIAKELAQVLNIQIAAASVMPHEKKSSHAKGVITLFDRFEAAGPYLNVFLNARGLSKFVLHIAADPSFGTVTPEKKKRIVLEFISPNTNKPLHLGHVRNGLLGESIARILEANGHKVHRTAVINDRGIHICKSMVAYMQDSLSHPDKTPATPASTHTKGDSFVGKYYVAFEKNAKKDPSWNDLAQECLRDWEKGDKSVHALWKKMNAWTMEGHEATYQRLGIHFDSYIHESAIYTEGKKIVKQALAKKIFKKDANGNIVAPLEAKGMPDKVVLRADGTTVYATQDIALAVKRQEKLKANETLYVVMKEQDLYLKQLFTILGMMKYSWAKHLTHVSYGMVHLPEGRMKSREGTVVDADPLLDGLEDLATKEVTDRYETLSPEEIDERANTIAHAALSYYMLEVNPESDMLYNPKESLSFHGRTGPYIMYTYARLKSVVRKAEQKKIVPDFTEYDWEAEKSIISLLAQFPATIEKAGETRSPALIARYVFELSKALNDYYHHTPILQASPKERSNRLYVITTASTVLKRALSLLCITPLEHM